MTSPLSHRRTVPNQIFMPVVEQRYETLVMLEAQQLRGFVTNLCSRSERSIMSFDFLISRAGKSSPHESGFGINPRRFLHSNALITFALRKSDSCGLRILRMFSNLGDVDFDELPAPV